LMNVKGGMLTTKPELRSLAETSGSLDDMVGLLSIIEDLKGVPSRLEERISEKRFLSAVDLLMDSLRGLRKSELENISALTDMRSYFATQESSLIDILVEELHDHLYLKSPYCADRWKKKQGNGQDIGGMAGLSETGHSWDRPVYHFLSNLDLSSAMEEDASKNPEADTFYYVHMILESLNKLGHLEDAVQRLEQRMPVELYRVVEKTNAEIDAKYPSHMRGQLNKDKRTFLTSRADDGRNEVLSDFLWALYAKFEAVAEGFRVLHEVVAGLAAREGIPKPEKVTGTFKELWKLYQMEIRSTLHDYLATDGDRGSNGGLGSAISADVFSKQQRDRKKRMFKLAEMDQKALGIKQEEEELDEILKSSVPGLVNKTKSKNKGLNAVSERGAYDNTSAGHKLLVEPGVFNMSVLLPPSLVFLQRLKEVVPQSSSIPISTLTSFLDDFLINVFHPQLEETVTELCSHCLLDIEAFEEDPLWSRHSPHPIFKGSLSFMNLIKSFSSMLASIPHDQMFTQLIINQLVTYYDKCFGFYKAIVSRVVTSPTNPNSNTLVLKAAASYAESGEIRDAAQELWNSSSTGKYSPDLVQQEVLGLLKAIKTSPISAYDIISDPKSVHQLSLLYNSMQWLSAALNQLATTSKSTINQNTRRWTLIKSLRPLSSSGGTAQVYLPLNNETAVPFDTTLSSFRNLATTSLLTLHLDIRLGILYQFSQILCGPELPKSPTSATTPSSANETTTSLAQRIDSASLPPLSSGLYPFVLPTPPTSASPLILRLNNDLISFDTNIASHLGVKERCFIATGLARLVDRYMVAGADHILVMNANGAERMRVDAMVVQQNLRGMLAGVRHSPTTSTSAPATRAGLGISDPATSNEGTEEDDGVLALTHTYYSLFLDGAEEIMRHVRDTKAQGKDVGFSYDELRTLIELCFSEALRGEDREESVRARKRCGDRLLELGEAM
jgi:exocyst complex component 4